MSIESVLLQPRPYAQVSGRLLLLPLLPQKPALKPLPSEIWWKIIGEVLDCGGEDFWRGSGMPNSTRLSLLTVCKSLKVCSRNFAFFPHTEQWMALLCVGDRTSTFLLPGPHMLDHIIRAIYNTSL